MSNDVTFEIKCPAGSNAAHPEIVLSSPVGVRIREELITVIFPVAWSCTAVERAWGGDL